MKRIPVNSSNVKAIGWHNNTLEVEFHSGGVYHYHNVPESKHAGIMASGSVGSYLHKHVKPFHGYRKVN